VLITWKLNQHVHILQEPPSKHHQYTRKMYNCSETMLLVDRIELVGRVFPHESKKGVWRRFLSSLKGREIMPVRGAAYVITVPKK